MPSPYDHALHTLCVLIDRSESSLIYGRNGICYSSRDSHISDYWILEFVVRLMECDDKTALQMTKLSRSLVCFHAYDKDCRSYVVLMMSLIL